MAKAKLWFAIQQHPILIILIYAVLATGLLLPLVPFDATRGSDTPDHIVLTIQARMAIDEGQFPLLVAPYERSGWLYPVFQFYSQIPFILGGLIYRYIIPANPDQANSLVLWLALIVAAADAQVVQLPVLYYPDLLEVWVNGKKVSYFDTPYRDFALVGVRLPPGNYQISVSFAGLTWAKWLSGITGMVSLGALGGYTIFKSLNKENLSV